MYTFADPRVLDMLQKVVTTFSRIGEFINVEASPDSLQLSTLNSSASVMGRVKLARPLFVGSGDRKTVQLKARSLDMIFRRLETDHVSALDLEFSTGHSRQEQVIIVFDNGLVTKEFVVPSLHTSVPAVDFSESSQSPFSFECLPSLLREAFASCDSSADELQIMFRPSLVSFLAQKRGKPSKKSIDIVRVPQNPGLKTLIKLQLDSFQQITALAPRQLDMKLKEFRTMLIFLDHMCEGRPLRAEFTGLNSSTPVVFIGESATFPNVEFAFKFMSKFSGPRNAPETWVRVGPQGADRQHESTRQHEVLPDETADSSMWQMREDRRKARRVEPLPDEILEVPPSPTEIGFTQPQDEVRGLFD